MEIMRNNTKKIGTKIILRVKTDNREFNYDCVYVLIDEHKDNKLNYTPAISNAYFKNNMFEWMEIPK